MKKYRKRVVVDLLARKLLGRGAVLVQGAKWCGKTTTCEEFAKSALYMADPDTKESNLQMADIDIKALLKGEKPRLIDEWQIAPKFWDAVRYHVDHSDGFGHFILTGSAVPPDTKEIAHSGTGRIARVTMRPMSLWESGESNGSVSLGGLLTGKEFTVTEKPTEKFPVKIFMGESIYTKALSYKMPSFRKSAFDIVIGKEYIILNGPSFIKRQKKENFSPAGKKEKTLFPFDAPQTFFLFCMQHSPR